MDVPAWIAILEALGPTLWALTAVTLVVAAALMFAAEGHERRRAARAEVRTSRMLDLAMSDNPRVGAIGS